jgi:hypothetical protein
MAIVSTQGFIFKLVANGIILDLFADEEIKLSDNVTGLFDLGVIPADFTRQISLPGSKKNNAFFEHVYDISVFNPDTFSTNVKVPCYLDFDGIYISQGYLQLNKVNVIANKFIDSYEVTIFGAISSFAKTITNTFLTQLTTLSQYNHTASFSNISASWAGELFNGDIVYPLAEYGQKMKYTSGDLFFGIDDNEGGLTVQDFKPSIRMKAVWDAIFEYSGYTYSGSFFNEPFLDDIYLVCNRALRYPVFDNVDLENYGVISIAPISGSGQTDLNIPQLTATNLPWYSVTKDPSGVVGQNSSYTLEVTSSLKGILTLEVKLSGSLGGPVTEFIVRDTGSLTQQSLTTLVNFNQFFEQNTYAMFAEGANGQNKTYTVSTEFTTGRLDPGTYYFGLQWRDIFGAPYNNFTFVLDPNGKPKSSLQITKVEQAADERIMDIPLNMPFGTNGIKLIDFIKGIQKKFNLVIYPSKTKKNEFIVETFNNWYQAGEIKDFNRYINLDEKIEVIPANNLAVNELNFGDTLDQDYISQQFSKGANREYGKQYYTDTENFFSQGKFEVKTTLASSPLIQIAGTGISGSVAGVNPPTPTSYYWSIGNSGFGSSYQACTDTYYYPGIVYSAEISPYTVTYLYLDQELTIPFNGDGSFWKFYRPSEGSSTYVAQIGSLGGVYAVQSC